MRGYRSILAGVDFSPCSASALAQAARLARDGDGALHVVHVVEGLVVQDLADALGTRESLVREEVAAGARARLAETLRPVAKPAELDVRLAVGVPVDEILRAIDAVSADLLVLGVTGAGPSGSGAGTLAIRCVRKSPVDVLLVGEGHAGPFRRILACTDFSDTAGRALEQAVRLARQDGSELHVLHVFDGPWHRLHYRAPTPQASADYRRQYRDALHGTLARCLERHAADLAGLDVHLELHDHPHHGSGIVEVARHLAADLLVLGSQGRTTLRYAVLGSTAEAALRELTCSALAVKPAGSENPAVTSPPQVDYSPRIGCDLKTTVTDRPFDESAAT